MSAADASESEELGTGETTDSDASVLGVVVSVWYLWLATAISALFTWIAYTEPRLSPSPTDLIVFGFLTVVLFVSGVYLAYYRYNA